MNGRDFPDEWKTVLAAKPAIEYFKSNEAYGLKGQFDGWDADVALKKMTALEGVIQKHIPERVSVAVSHASYSKYLDGIPIRNRFTYLNDPYFLLFYEIVTVSLAIQTLKPKPAQCDFIFDEYGKIGEAAVAYWRGFKIALKNAMDVRYDPYIGSPPILRNDKSFVALQAADLYAGQIRRFLHIPTSQIANRDVSHGFSDRGHFYCHRHLTEEYLQETRDQLMEVAKSIENSTPGALKRRIVVTKPTPRKKK